MTQGATSTRFINGNYRFKTSGRLIATMKYRQTSLLRGGHWYWESLEGATNRKRLMNYRYRHITMKYFYAGLQVALLQTFQPQFLKWYVGLAKVRGPRM